MLLLSVLQEGIYHVLFFLAGLPKLPELRQEAVQMLQLLPTCSWIPEQLQEALSSHDAANKLKSVLLEQQQQGALHLPKLLYTLQVHHIALRCIATWLCERVIS